MWFLLGCLSPSPELAVQPKGRVFRTLTVDCNGSGRYPSILAALDDARSGDVISVAPCTYEGSIHFKGKSVTIQSTAGPGVTTIVGTPGEPVVKVNDGEGRGTVVAGFTLTGGGGDAERSIEVQFSSLVLRDDIVTGNTGTETLYSNAGHVIVERTT